MLEAKKVVKIANTLDRAYLRRTFAQLNELPEIKLKVNIEFSDDVIENALGISFVNQINSIPEEDFDRLCKDNMFPKEAEKLYLVLTGQTKPEQYMISKVKFTKKSKERKVIRIDLHEPEPPAPKYLPPTKKPKAAKGVQPDNGQPDRNAFNMKRGTISYKIAEMIMKNKYTIKEIVKAVERPDPFVYAVMRRMKENKDYYLFDELSAGRKVIGCEKKR